MEYMSLTFDSIGSLIEASLHSRVNFSTAAHRISNKFKSTLDCTHGACRLVPATSKKARYYLVYPGLLKYAYLCLAVYARRIAATFNALVSCNDNNVFGKVTRNDTDNSI